MWRVLAVALAAAGVAGCAGDAQRARTAPEEEPLRAATLFAVLRGPSAPGDTLPHAVARTIRRHPERPDPAGARRAGPSLWVVPAERAVCLVYARRLVNIGCAPLDLAARGMARQSLMGSDYGLPHGRKLVYGIVPDGVRAVDLDLDQTAVARTLPIRRNVWRTVLDARARGSLHTGLARMPLP